MPRCIDAKRQSLYKAAGQLRSEAAKFFVVVEFVKFLSLLTKRNCLFSRPNGERRNFLANASELRNFREGYNSKINKITRHSCMCQEELSLNAQDDENLENVGPSPAFVVFAEAH